ncbi:transposase [Burkholderia cepacia]|uniref:transposase n=1 Tax=Burkholderia cepacia TaxID=292 RepID=UPI00234B261C|nr:transposase [Burkholderia cepacia]MDC6101949.1 transposase [Burkholderia cepacia]
MTAQIEIGAIMAQHFLLSARSRDLTVWDVVEMTEEQCFWKFVQLRWGSQDTVPCLKCGTIDRPYARVDRGQLRCRHCDHHFSPLSWTVFADRKMSFKKMLLAVCLFTASAKGIPALFLSRVLDVQAKTASVFVGKHS